VTELTHHAYVPVPAPARGPALSDEGYVLEEIGERLFWLADGFYQMMFLVTDDGVVAVDAPPTLGHNIIRAIRKVTTAGVTHAVYSHSHADHVGAMVIYERAQLYAQEQTAQLLRRDADPNRPPPTQTFAESMTLEIEGESLQLDYHGPNHSPGNAFIYAPRQKTLMLVDVVFPGWVPFACLAVSQDIPAWLAAPAKALGYPFETFVGGHLNRLGNRADVEVHQEFTAELKAECERAIDTFDLGSVFAESDPANPWAIFRSYFDGVCAEVVGALAPRWRERLGGVDVFTDLNAFTMVESLRLDYGRLGPLGIRD
jgi:glyoxylase-like metal-dependent hydrolase (beta-lactamase superfamily II)